MGNGHALFYKLNLEAYLMGAAAAARPAPASFVVVKPGGLTDDTGGNSTLVVGHEDSIKKSVLVARADVATVLRQALLSPSLADNVRFDLCSKPGAATTDWPSFFRAARRTSAEQGQ